MTEVAKIWFFLEPVEMMQSTNEETSDTCTEDNREKQKFYELSCHG